MSGDYWLNRVGTAATATTPAGTVPQYGLAFDLGTAQWPDARTFNTAMGDAARRRRTRDIQAMEQARREADEKQGWFQKNIMGGFQQLVGDNPASAVKSVPILGTYLSLGMEKLGIGDDPTTEEQRLERGAERLQAFSEAPVIKQLNQVFDATTRPIETAFILDRNTAMRGDLGMWFDGSEWGKAWREADERTLGEAFVDAVVVNKGTTHADLDRIRRTNSLYGLTSFGIDLVAGFKLDPTVLGAKVLGEGSRIAKGAMPRGQSSKVAAAEARRAAFAEDPLAYRPQGFNPMRHYGAWRGRKVAGRFDKLRVAAETMPFSQFSDLPMFKRRAVNGPQAAMAFQIAAKDDKLWDLTRRAVMGDPRAYAEINQIKRTPPEALRNFYDGDVGTFIDAVEATKTKVSLLDDEIADLEKTIARREEFGPQPLSPKRPGGGINRGFFEYHTWELKRDLADKIRDVEEANAHLAHYDDYGTWLEKVKDGKTFAHLDGVSTKEDAFRSWERVYQKSSLGKVHRIAEVPRAVWTSKANPIDLHRVDSGVMSIRRQFDQMKHLFGYENPEALDDALTRFVRAKDPTERFKIAQEVEDAHLVTAISQRHGLSSDTIEEFLTRTRARRNEMAQALLTGNGAVYSTAPIDNAKLIKIEDGIAQVEMMDKGQRVTLRVPEEALQSHNLALDPTQTPNYYMPMDAREIHLAIKRDAELWQMIDSDLQNGARRAAGATMDVINDVGTKWNQFWKPVQLFRLAWPQRVLMDESFRAMAALGASAWARNFFPALGNATINALNPKLHGIGPFLRRRRLRVGPGPLADEITGRDFDTFTHEQIIDEAPVVHERFAPKYDPKRGRVVEDYVGNIAQARTRRTRAQALLRNPNPRQSLPADYPDQPHNWLDLDDVLEGKDPVLDGGSFTRAPRDPRGLELDGEDFTTADLIYAAKAYQMSDEDVIALLGGNGANELALIEDFLMKKPETQKRLWDGAGARSNEWEQALMEDQSLPVDLKDKIRNLVHEGKQLYDAELNYRRSGAGAGPLFSGVFEELDSPTAKLELMMARDLGAKYVPVSQNVDMTSGRAIRRAVNRNDLGAGANESLTRAVVDHFWQSQPPAGMKRPVLFDLDGKKTGQGFAVRVATTRLPQIRPLRMHEEIENLIGANAGLLSSKGYRLMLEGDELSVVRYFNTGQKADAIEFARQIEADSFYRLGGLQGKTSKGTLTGQPGGPGYEVYVRDWNDRSPIMEALDRRFASEAEVDLTPSQAPIPGRPAVYHGARNGLPMDESGNAALLPREDVPAVHGNLVGQGFYTTISKDVALSYGDPNTLYTIRGSKSGKTYKVFDVEQRPSVADRDELREFMQSYYDDLIEAADAESIYFSQDDLDYVLGEVRQSRQWIDLIANLEDMYVVHHNAGKKPQQLVTDFLIKKYDAGALTYTGGRLIGGFGEHQVFVWLFPEDLLVRPAYDKTGKFYLLEEWFANPNSQEQLVNRVPESRIIRTGRMDKRFNELEQIHRKAEARTKADFSHFNDPTWHALVAREQKIMHELGLEYTHNVTGRARWEGVTPDEGNWWTQVDPERIPRERARAELFDRASAGYGEDVQRAFDNALSGLEPDFRHVDSVHERFVRRLMRKREFGKGYSKWRTADGSKVEVQNFLEGEGEVYLPHISAAPAFARLSDTYKRTLSMMQKRAIGYKRVQPPDLSPEVIRTAGGKRAALTYYAEWADLLNDQIRNSPIWYRMLRGDSDEAIVDWLRNTDEGARIRRSHPALGQKPEKWVEEHRQRLEFYLPDENLRTLLAERKLDAAELQRVKQRDLPEIYAPDIEILSGTGGMGKLWQNFTTKMYHALGTVPTDLLSRQPFAKAMYDLKMRNLIRSADAEWLTPEILKDFESLSREFAIKQLRRTLFDLTDETNFTEAIRFLSPFWGAQQEAIMKWANLMVERPETFARFYVGMEMLYDEGAHHFVIDEDGRPVPDIGFAEYNSNHRIIFQIPEGLKKVPWLGEAIQHFGSVGIPIGSANTALQGENPFLPSLGPVVTVPADQLADHMWDTHGTEFDDNFFYRWLFPVGRGSSTGASGVLEQIFPGWGRRVQAMEQGGDSRMWMNTWFTVQREMQLDYKRRGIKRGPTAEEVDKAAKWHMGLRILASFGAPAAMEFRPENQFFLDQYHSLQRQYGPKAFEKFVKIYGADAAKYAASSSNGLLPPTSQGMAEWKDNRKLFQEIADGGFPDLASLIISPQAWSDEFSSDAYGEQFQINVGPGSSTKLRESQDPQARMDQTDIRLGWLAYRQLSAALDVELQQRGLTSLSQTAAGDLKDHKDAQVALLMQQYPAWARDYRSYEDTVYFRVAEMQKIAASPAFDDRPDIQGLRQYLMIRQQVAQSLDAWSVQGGSRSLQAEENTPLREWWESQVGALKAANPAFADLHDRFLASDRLERGSGP